MSNELSAGIFILLAMTGTFFIFQINGEINDAKYLALLAEKSYENATHIMLLNDSNSAEFLERNNTGYNLWHFSRTNTQMRFGSKLAVSCAYEVFNGSKKVSVTGRPLIANYSLEKGRILSAFVLQESAGKLGRLNVRTDLYPAIAKQTIEWNPVDELTSYGIQMVCTDFGELPGTKTLLGSATGLPSGSTLQWPENFDRVSSAKLNDYSTAKDKFVLRFKPMKGRQVLDPAIVSLNRTKCSSSYINLVKQDVSVVNYCFTYSVRNPAGIRQSWSDSTMRELFRTLNSPLVSRGGLSEVLESQAFTEHLQYVQRNNTFADARKNCTQTRSVPNATFSCNNIVTSRVVQENATEIVRTKGILFSIDSGEEQNITFCGRRKPNSVIDQVPEMDIGGSTYTCTEFAWANSSYGKRHDMKVGPSGNIDVPHVLTVAEWNLSNFTEIVNYCSNHSVANCTEIAMVWNDTDSNFYEICHNITKWNNTNTAWLTSFLPNQTGAQVNTSSFNYTLSAYFNASRGDKSCKIWEHWDDDFTGGVGRMFNTTWAGSVVQSVNFRGVLTQNSISQGAAGGTQDSTSTAGSTPWSNAEYTILFSVYKTSGSGARFSIIGDVAASGFQTMSKCGGGAQLGRASSAETCTASVYNPISVGFWNEIKYSGTSTTGNYEMYINGRGQGPDSVTVLGRMYVGDTGASASNESVDRVRVSLWNVTRPENDTAWGFGFIENFSVAPVTIGFTITQNQPANNSVLQQGIVYGLNATVVGQRSLFNCSLRINDTVNLTLSDVANNTKFEFNQSFNPGGYRWDVNCSVGSAINASLNWTFTVPTYAFGITQNNPADAATWFFKHNPMSLNFTLTGQSTHDNCSVRVNGTVNVTIPNVVNGTLTEANTSFSRGVWRWDVNCTTAFSSNVSANRTLYVNNTLPAINPFPLPVINATANRLLTYDINGSDDDVGDNASLVFIHNASFLFVLSSAGLISVTFNDTQVGIYNITVTVNDTFGTNSTTYLLNISNISLNMGLCRNMSKILLRANISYLNISTGKLTQYNISPDNQSICGFSVNVTVNANGTLQCRINVTYNSSYVLRHNNTAMDTTWKTLVDPVVTGTNYTMNVSADVINATQAAAFAANACRVI